MIYFAIWNILVFFLYGWDKLMAKRKGWRIPESCLLATAFIAGGIGAACGMTVFNHKTKKWLFRFMIPLSLLLTVCFIKYVI